MSELFTGIDSKLSADLDPTSEQIKARNSFIAQTLGAVALERLRFCVPILRTNEHETAESIYFGHVDELLTRPPEGRAKSVSQRTKDIMTVISKATYFGLPRHEQLQTAGLAAWRYDIEYEALVSYIKTCDADSGWLDNLFTIARAANRPFQQPSPQLLASKLDDSLELENRLQAVGLKERSIAIITALFLGVRDIRSAATEYDLNPSRTRNLLINAIGRLEEIHGDHDPFLARTVKKIIKPRSPRLVSGEGNTKEVQSLMSGEKEKILTAEEEVRLAKEIECGLYAKHLLENAPYGHYLSEEIKYLTMAAELGNKAFWRFVSANIGLVYKHIQISTGKFRYWRLSNRQGINEFDELVASTILEGLVTAVQHFDFTLGNKFSVYANYWLRFSTGAEIARRMPVTIGRNALGLIEQIQLRITEIQMSEDRTPTIDELSQYFRLKPERIKYLQETHSIIRSAVSLQQSLSENKTYEDIIALPVSQDTEHIALGIGTEKALSEDLLVHLSGQQRFIIAHDIQLGGRPQLTDPELAERLNRTTVNRVRILRQNALAILKAQILAD